MIRKTFKVDLKDEQELLFVPLGDIHYDTAECDRPRLKRFVKWALKQEAQGKVVRILGLGDYLDIGSPSTRAKIAQLYDSTKATLDREAMRSIKELYGVLEPIKHCFWGLLTGHHTHRFVSAETRPWQGKTADQWLAKNLGCAALSDGSKMAALLGRIRLPHSQHLDLFALHGGGGAQTPGGRVMKRVQFAEIAPTAHLVISGHDNAKLAYPRSGLDFSRGSIKRYVIGSGSFQRAYLEGQTGYAEEWGLIPADLGVTVVTIKVEKQDGKWKVDYHASV